ncbi:uncharacterized protein LOC113272976 [Papaver somniferum]|uniref:uncharacterized protein LOC113272976 n=1 Tax=Papaver somniferum TaxID=3469 RepID=UPI000E6F5E61|nr:uncharacterized protein LOC113272976 [Papaver somniferum]
MAIHHKGEEDVTAKSETLKFPQFEIINATDANHNDHYYFSSNHDHLSQKSTAYIMREWNILKDSLPNFIYVRAFEGRIDLLTAIRVSVITSKPEPTYSDQCCCILPTYWGFWMEKEYLTFNQDMFMLNCQTMLAVLNKPPKHLKQFVAQHFRDHAESILIACKSYIDPSALKVDKHASSKDEYGIKADDSEFSTTTPIKEE